MATWSRMGRLHPRTRTPAKPHTRTPANPRTRTPRLPRTESTLQPPCVSALNQPYKSGSSRRPLCLAQSPPSAPPLGVAEWHPARLSVGAASRRRRVCTHLGRPVVGFAPRHRRRCRLPPVGGQRRLRRFAPILPHASLRPRPPPSASPPAPPVPGGILTFAVSSGALRMPPCRRRSPASRFARVKKLPFGGSAITRCYVK